MIRTENNLFEGPLNTANLWLREVMDWLGCHDRPRVWHALQTVLHALRDRLAVADAVKLGTRLPLLVRGLYYDGWQAVPVTDKPFLASVAAALPNDPGISPEEVTRAVFHLLAEHVSPDEIPGLRRLLVGELDGLWPAECRRCGHSSVLKAAH